MDFKECIDIIIKNSINEDITEKGKKLLKDNHFNVVDSVTEGNYEMYLVHHIHSNMYQIGLQRKGYDFTNLDQQRNKIPNDRSKGSISTFKNAINKWLSSYHKIFCDSESPEKSAQWTRILNKLGYKVYDDYGDIGRKYIKG
jgi:hypothetical protein